MIRDMVLNGTHRTGRVFSHLVMRKHVARVETWACEMS